ncbi:MAG: glycogen/starch synthase [Deltaproteobacteria bacterium]|nr:glycogen/starch synthase [Deltaproteobacteria bacterium]MBW2211264.1 glycogen/starch synthase [Deltaproteobacteria bacterium]MBW2685770.1 glycogen/starch synthase [Deltaproteobacteria bacterium]
MRILFIAPQAFTSTRDAQDVATLAKVMRRADHSVDMVSPLYGHIDTAKLALARRLTKLELELGGRAWSCELYTGRTPDGVGLTFIGNEEVLLSADSLTGEGEQLDASRVGVFAAAVTELIRQNASDYDIVHAHGWAAAAAVARLRSELPDLPTVLTVYDASHQGRFDAGDAESIGLGDAARDGEGVNVLKGGLLAADRVTTLSPNYAHRLQRPDNDDRLSEVFREIEPKTSGVRHGIDPALWNPATDGNLPARFDPFDMEGKDKCKAELQHDLTLPVRSDVPLFAAIGGVDDDGMALLAKIGPDFLRNDVQLVVQLDGDGELVAIYEELWDQWPDRVQIKTGDDEAFRHALIAASDFVVAPGHDAPSDNIQMRAQRYGALPIVHRDGGLADEVVDCEASLKTGSGILFDEPTTRSLLSAVQRGAAAFANNKAFREVQSRVMRIDHSWERTTRLYERTYREAISAHAG